jgi:PIN like domain
VLPPQQPPEFFLDRSLGRRVGDGLEARGWTIHRVAEHFPLDAQHIPDEVWLAYGLERGWSPLCKDGRIRGRQVEREPLERFGAVLFYLDNQRLLVDEMVWRFHRSQDAIYRAVRRGPATYAVGSDGIRRTWP